MKNRRLDAGAVETNGRSGRSSSDRRYQDCRCGKDNAETLLVKGIAMSEDGTIREFGHYESTEVGHEKKYETVVSSGQSALKALLTMNGGAIIAFLTFIGHLWEKDRLPRPESVSLFVTSLEILVVGTFLTVLAHGTIFLTNVLSRIERPRASDRMFIVTLVIGFLSAGCFLVASLFAVHFFLSVSKEAKTTTTVAVGRAASTSAPVPKVIKP
jgi:hypothetical protein